MVEARVGTPLLWKHDKMIKVKVITDGSPAGTRLVDADTGEVLHFDGHVQMDVVHGEVNKNHIIITFVNVPMETTPAVTGSFHLQGVTTGGKEGLPPTKESVVKNIAKPTTTPKAQTLGGEQNRKPIFPGHRQ